jgi:hypothetical protein
LRNDGFETGDAVAFVNGFVAGEQGAVVLGPVESTYAVDSVTFLFGGIATAWADVRLNIYRDEGTANPGSLLFTEDYEVAPSDTAFQQLDLTGEDVVVTGGGSIRISMEFLADAPPSIARDTDGTISASKNWVFTSGSWNQSSDYGITGDWIIRAAVTTQ